MDVTFQTCMVFVYKDDEFVSSEITPLQVQIEFNVASGNRDYKHLPNILN